MKMKNEGAESRGKARGRSKPVSNLIAASVVFIAACVIFYQTVVYGCTIASWKDLWSFQFSCPPRDVPSLNLPMPDGGRRVWQFGPTTTSCSMPVTIPHTMRGLDVTISGLTAIAEGQAGPIPPNLLPADIRAQIDHRGASAILAGALMNEVFLQQALSYAPAGSDEVCWHTSFGTRHGGARVSITGRSLEHGRPCATVTTRIEAVANVPAAPEEHRKFCREPDGFWARL